MLSLLRQYSALRSDKRAVTALEYGLIAAAVVAIGLAGFSVIGDTLANKVSDVSTVLTDAPATPPDGTGGP